MKKPLFCALAAGLFLSSAVASFGQTSPTQTTPGTGTGMQGQGNRAERVMTNKDLAASVGLSSDFSTLQKALQAAGLEERAKGAGPYTVFAPANSAFDKLPSGKLDELLKSENKEKLVKLLGYHVVQGNVAAADLKDGQTLQTVGGGSLRVRKQGATVSIQDAGGNTARVIMADVKATNGTVHAVDSVLMPADK